ncbi:MAG: Heme oxygenase [Cytophagaceae bacterium]|jgi:heme oxygenase|nr:Heme oxygenase [Cytophagaceae bacterium]
MLSAKIKEQTTGSHRLLESHPLFASLNGRFDEQQYQLLLHKLYTYYSELEKQYVPFFLDQPLLEIEKRQRAHILEKDRANRPQRVTLSANQKLSLPVLDSIWKATGALYVIEGSTLGGKFICQSLAQIGIDPSNGAAYFSGYGEETGKMWKSFLQFLNEVATTEEQEQEVITTAEQVFSTLYNWLGRND